MRHWYLTVLSRATLRVRLKQRISSNGRFPWPRAVGRLRQIGRDSKPCVIAGQEVPEHGIGLVYGAGAGETQFGHQPVLKSAGGTFHSAMAYGSGRISVRCPAVPPGRWLKSGPISTGVFEREARLARGESWAGRLGGRPTGRWVRPRVRSTLHQDEASLS